jgi:hypothetical protein
LGSFPIRKCTLGPPTLPQLRKYKWKNKVLRCMNKNSAGKLYLSMWPCIKWCITFSRKSRILTPNWTQALTKLLSCLKAMKNLSTRSYQLFSHRKIPHTSSICKNCSHRVLLLLQWYFSIPTMDHRISSKRYSKLKLSKKALKITCFVLFACQFSRKLIILTSFPCGSYRITLELVEPVVSQMSILRK